MISSPPSNHLRHWAEKGHALRPSAKLPVAGHLWEEFGLWTEGSGAGKKIHLPNLAPEDKGRKQERRASGLTHTGEALSLCQVLKRGKVVLFFPTAPG